MSDTTTALTVPEPVSVPGITQTLYDKQEQFRQQLQDNLPQLIAALPSGMRHEVVTQMAMTAALDNPALLECSPLSLFRAVLKMASLGLRNGETADLVPIKNKAECWVRVKGVVELAQRAGAIQWARIGYVCDGDLFEYEERENGQHFRHRANAVPAHDGANVTHVFASVILVSGVRVLEVWTKARILEHKNRHVRNVKADSPWNTNPLPMYGKTVLKAALRFAPLSPEVRTAMAAGDEVTTGSFEVVGGQDPTRALAAMSGALDALAEADSTPAGDDDETDTETRMTLARAEDMTTDGRRLATLTDAELHKLLARAQTAGRVEFVTACEIILADRQDRFGSAAVA